MEKHYNKLWADIIYPAVWGKDYEEPVLLDFDSLDIDDLDTSTDMVDKSNIYARDKNKFKSGNQQGIRFTKNRNDNVELNTLFNKIDKNTDNEEEEE